MKRRRPLLEDASAGTCTYFTNADQPRALDRMCEVVVTGTPSPTTPLMALDRQKLPRPVLRRLGSAGLPADD